MQLSPHRIIGKATQLEQRQQHRPGTDNKDRTKIKNRCCTVSSTDKYLASNEARRKGEHDCMINGKGYTEDVSIPVQQQRNSKSSLEIKSPNRSLALQHSACHSARLQTLMTSA